VLAVVVCVAITHAGAGLDDYIKAAHICASSSYQQAISKESIDRPTRLAWEKDLVARFATISKLVHEANLAPLPEQPGPELAPSEYQDLPEVTRFLSCEAYVKLSQGHTASATAAIIEGLNFAERLPLLSKGLAARTTARESEAPLLLQVRARSRMFSMDDWDKMQVLATKALERPNWLDGLATLLRQDAASLPPTEQKQASQLTPQQQSAIKEALLKAAKAVDAAQSAPESDWTLALNSADMDVDGLLKGLDQDQQLTAYLTGEACRRTWLRLLRLHACIERYTLENTHMPSKLLDCADAAWCADPLSGKNFAMGQSAKSSLDCRRRRGINDACLDDLV